MTAAAAAVPAATAPAAPASAGPARAARAAARVAHADFGRDAVLVDVDLVRIDLAVVVAIEHMEEAHRVGAELGAVDAAVVVGVDPGEPRLFGMLDAERLAHRADEQIVRLAVASRAVAVRAAVMRRRRAIGGAGAEQQRRGKDMVSDHAAPPVADMDARFADDRLEGITAL